MRALKLWIRLCNSWKIHLYRRSVAVLIGLQHQLGPVHICGQLVLLYLEGQRVVTGVKLKDIDMLIRLRFGLQRIIGGVVERGFTIIVVSAH